MNIQNVRTFFQKASKKLGFAKKPKPTLSDDLIRMAAERQTSPRLFNAVMKAVIKVKGLRGYQRRQFRNNWRTEYNWRDTTYLKDAAEIVRGL